jgi:ubiquinone/menaquinone biosynthesis C-methylase UbiE
LAFDSYPYGRVAAIYDELADLYSIGRIGMSKRFALEVISPGDDVLFAGVGRGAEAIEAAALGGRVHAVDLSPEMLRRFSEQVDHAGLEAIARVEDVSLHDPSEPYDVVVANYFLNLFDAKHAGEMLEVLVRCLGPGGRLVIADFECPSNHFLSRLISGQ